MSDRDAKQSFKPVSPEDVLRKLESIPISTWQYKSEVSGAQHMGPMAQDFHAAYGLGDSDKSITTVDAEGVALAAIQGLAQRLREKDAKLAEQEARIAKLEQAIAGRGERMNLSAVGLGLGGLVVAGVFAGRRRRPARTA